MMTRVRVLRGLFHPARTIQQLDQAEDVRGVGLCVFLSIFLNIILFTIGAIYGVGSEALSKDITKLSPQSFEWEKYYFLLGHVLFGLLFSVAVLYITSYIYKLFTAITYRKLVVLQLYIFPILLLEKAISVLLAIGFSLPWYSSFLSLGVIGQSFSDNPILIYFLGSVTIFQIWVMMVQYQGLRTLNEEMDRKVILCIVMGLHLVFWFITAWLFHSVDVSQLIKKVV